MIWYNPTTKKKTRTVQVKNLEVSMRNNSNRELHSDIITWFDNKTKELRVVVSISEKSNKKWWEFWK